MMGVSVIIPTFGRPSALNRTLDRIKACDPRPAEILVHIDFGDEGTAEMLSESHPDCRVFESSQKQGPGGGRHKLMKLAKHETVVSLDDDSYPMHEDFFSKASGVVGSNERLGVVGCEIIHRGERTPRANEHLELKPSRTFVGCGCIYRRSAYLSVPGYLPIQPAYGIEEVDVSLQLLDNGWEIATVSGLRVFHDTDLTHHENPSITGASIKNAGLLVFVRYPALMWLLGGFQLASKVFWLVRHGRRRGIFAGFWHLPGHIAKYRAHRRPVSSHTLLRWVRRT